MSLFGDYDIASAADDPFSVADGTYEGVLARFYLDEGTSKKTGDPYKILKAAFTFVNGQKYEHPFFLPTEKTSPEAAERQRSAIKGFLAGMEVPVAKMNTVKPEELEGTAVIVTKKTVSRPGTSFVNLTVQLSRGTRVGRVNPSSNGADEFAKTRVAAVSDEEFGLS